MDNYKEIKQQWSLEDMNRYPHLLHFTVKQITDQEKKHNENNRRNNK